MKKKIFQIIFLASILSMLLAFKAFAFLGTYEPGDNIVFNFVCLEDGGRADNNCVGGQAELLAYSGQGDIQIIVLPDDSVSETGQPGLFPGAWKVNFTIPQLSSANQAGPWAVYVNITNANGTAGATFESFQVVFENQGINSTGANVVTALSNQAVIQAAIKTTNDTIKERTASINATIKDVNSSIHAKILDINQSILYNLSRTSFSSSVSTGDQKAIGLECAKQTLGANVTTTFILNLTSFFVQKVNYDYAVLGLNFNETYRYNNLSMLNLTNRTIT